MRQNRLYRHAIDLTKRLPYLVIAIALVVLFIGIASLIIFRSIFTDDENLLELVKATIWPLIVIVAIFVSRKPVQKLFEAIGGRASKISAFNVELELGDIATLRPWSGPSLDEIKNPEPTSWTSDSAGMLFEQIKNASPSDYAIVDLGTGQSWLTSRLYIFAVMLQRMRGLKCIVFLRTVNGIDRSFVGTANPDDVRWSIALQEPWVEQAFIKAYQVCCGGSVQERWVLDERRIKSRQGALDPTTATNLVRGFIDELANRQDDLPGNCNKSEWTQLDIGRWERAKWIHEKKLVNILDNALKRAWVYEDALAEWKSQGHRLLRKDSEFVAVLEDDKRFRFLVDRIQLLTNLAKHYGESI